MIQINLGQAQLLFDGTGTSVGSANRTKTGKIVNILCILNCYGYLNSLVGIHWKYSLDDTCKYI